MKIWLFPNVFNQSNSISIRIIFNNIIFIVLSSHFYVVYRAASFIFDWFNDPHLVYVFKVSLVNFLCSRAWKIYKYSWLYTRIDQEICWIIIYNCQLAYFRITFYIVYNTLSQFFSESDRYSHKKKCLS